MLSHNLLIGIGGINQLSLADKKQLTKWTIATQASALAGARTPTWAMIFRSFGSQNAPIGPKGLNI